MKKQSNKVEKIMKTLLVGLHAETFLHPGSGQNDGAIDLPIARERSTDYPVIYGSMLKGALRARKFHASAGDNKSSDSVCDEYFGKQENAGGILVGDARLLLLPVRSLSASFKWVICPQIIQRFASDLARSGQNIEIKIPQPKRHHYLSHKSEDEIFLEEWLFEKQEQNLQIDALLDAIQTIMPEMLRESLNNRLVIVNDDDFATLVRQGTPVHARNQLNKETKSSENLWYEETLSPDTLFYSLFLPRFKPELLAEFAQTEIAQQPYLQIGGNETVGQGWVQLTPFQQNGATA